MKTIVIYIVPVIFIVLVAFFLFQDTEKTVVSPEVQHLTQPVLGWAASSPINKDMLIDFSDAEAWTIYADHGVESQFTQIQDRTRPALRIQYTFPEEQGNWVGGKIDLNQTLPEQGRVGFWLRGEGRLNNIEIKLSDQDGTTFMRNIINGAGTSDWRWVEMDLREFRYVWGGTNELLENPLTLEVTVARGHGTIIGGSGWVDIEGVYLVGANPRLELAASQVGFDPTAPKKAVINLINAPTNWQKKTAIALPQVTLVDHATKTQQYKVVAINQGSHPWGGHYWIVDFSAFTNTGRYELLVDLETPGGLLKVQSYPFEIAKTIIARQTAASQFNYIRSTRYPTNHPHEDPVPGGYIDTEFDIEKWMTTTPSWVWGMAHFLRGFTHDPLGNMPEAWDELVFAVDFMLAMQDPNDGGVYIGVNKTFDDVWPCDITVETDTAERILTQGKGLDINTTYAIAMAEASMTLETEDPEKSAACLHAAIQAWQWSVDQNPTQTQDLGNLLWASMRLYEATEDLTYLDQAKTLAALILPRQFTDATRGEDGVCGRFFRTDEHQDFNYQYKYVHAAGIELGLLELATALLKEYPLRKQITTAMTLYVQHFLMKSAAGTPYGVVGQALEPDSDTGIYKVMYFAATKTYGCAHGLNCDILASGLVAARYARLVDDPAGITLAWDQLQWVLGMNPFGFCMISGIGTTNPYTMVEPWGKGPILGGLINGVIGTEAQDIPGYDVTWGSSEYWKPHNAMFLAMLAELEGKMDNK